MAKFNKRSFKKKLDRLWSEKVRKRDGKCLVCGKTPEYAVLQAHHAIVTKGRSQNTRWDVRNGVTMCYACHICKLHGSSDKGFLQAYLDALNRFIPKDVQTEIEIKSCDIFKENQDNFQEVYESLID